MTNNIDRESFYALVTHLNCQECGVGIEVKELGFELKNEDDIDLAYDEDLCCEAPMYIAVINSDKPLFPEDDSDSEVNLDAHIRANPRIGLLQEQWRYELDDDFFESVAEQQET